MAEREDRPLDWKQTLVKIDWRKPKVIDAILDGHLNRAETLLHAVRIKDDLIAKYETQIEKLKKQIELHQVERQPYMEELEHWSRHCGFDLVFKES